MTPAIPQELSDMAGILSGKDYSTQEHFNQLLLLCYGSSLHSTSLLLERANTYLVYAEHIPYMKSHAETEQQDDL